MSEATEGSTVQDSSTESYAESQGLEVVSEAELQGEDSTSEDSTSDDSTSDDSTSEDSTSDDSSKSDKSGGTDTSKDDSTELKTVPLEALHEARNVNKYLKEQIQTLTETLAKTKSLDQDGKDTQKPGEKESDFKVLSEEEFISLAEDDPIEAMKYNMRLAQHNIDKIEAQKTDQITEEMHEAEAQIVNSAINGMNEAVPGIFEEDSTTQKELVEYAESVGFTDDMFYLTNPGTKVILPGETEPLLLGDQAVSILKVLNFTKEAVTTAKNSVDKDAIREEIRKEVETEVLAKLKKGSNNEFKSVSQLHKTDTATEFGNKVLSDAEFNKLTDKEQEAYLSGM